MSTLKSLQARKEKLRCAYVDHINKTLKGKTYDCTHQIVINRGDKLFYPKYIKPGYLETESLYCFDLQTLESIAATVEARIKDGYLKEI